MRAPPAGLRKDITGFIVPPARPGRQKPPRSRSGTFPFNRSRRPPLDRSVSKRYIHHERPGCIDADQASPNRNAADMPPIARNGPFVFEIEPPMVGGTLRQKRRGIARACIAPECNQKPAITPVHQPVVVLRPIWQQMAQHHTGVGNGMKVHGEH